MRRRPALAESIAADDLVRLSQASRRIGGLLDTATLARRAAREFGELVGTDASGVSIREAPGTLVTRAGWGVRTEEVRDGLRVAVGADSERLIERLVRQEGVHGMLGVPIKDRGEVIGVLYGMNRTPGHVGDRARALALEFAAALGPALGAAMTTGHAARRSAAAERRRISRELCESLGPWLLDISEAARRAGEAAADADILADLRNIEAQAAEAAAWVDEVLQSPDPGAEALPGAIGVDVEGFAGLGDLAADFAVVGEPYELLAEQETVLLAVVRLGLHVVATRASATSVLVTLRYAPLRCGVQVEDDGRERDGTGDRDPALDSLRDALARLDGELVVGSGEGGGGMLRGSVPVRPH
ncbi:MAG TPA: GAF domain-containing protein [Candidatus Dormibacteraeota bacterium]|jgi:GAF domain-containing protein|nr:GAF domain-containing protein [Candidatus Dormibacteraeota bacterium]